jgi:hypothetical protein
MDVQPTTVATALAMALVGSGHWAYLRAISA